MTKNGCHQSWKIYLAKNTRIGNKCIRGAGKASGKVGPDGDPRHVKDSGVNAIGRYFGNAGKNDQKHNGRNQGLHQIPDRTKNSLLVLGNKVAPDK